ncbi:MAG: hypothetical protein HY774_21965 [Acidobacteria bacterium]|nr:hypothetical protein [Acidobacteriota bacterium]
MKFQYILHRAGWATAILSCQDQTIEMTVSYLHDSLRNLASAVIALLNGATEVSVIFMDEPGEHRLVLRRKDQTTVSLEVRWYEDWYSWGIGSSDFETLLSGVTRLTHLRGQVLSAMKQILDEHGEIGYKQKWCLHEFPMEELRQLQASYRRSADGFCSEFKL